MAEIHENYLPIDFHDWNSERQVKWFEAKRALDQSKNQSKISIEDRIELKEVEIFCTSCGTKHVGNKDYLNYCQNCGTIL